jgi:hypothetical protein
MDMDNDIRHIIIDETMSIMISCGRITINAGSKDNEGISFSVPLEIGQTFLGACQKDEHLVELCRPIANLLEGFNHMLKGLLLGSSSFEEFNESLTIINTAMGKTNIILLALVNERMERLRGA